MTCGSERRYPCDATGFCCRPGCTFVDGPATRRCWRPSVAPYFTHSALADTRGSCLCGGACRLQHLEAHWWHGSGAAFSITVSNSLWTLLCSHDMRPLCPDTHRAHAHELRGHAREAADGQQPRTLWCSTRAGFLLDSAWLASCSEPCHPLPLHRQAL